MHLLYLDDSGSTRNESDKHVILAGLSVFETKPYWLSQRMDCVAKQVWPDNFQSIEFHGSAMFSGRGHWRGVERELRKQAFQDCLRIIADDREVRVFSAAIEKVTVAPQDPMEYAFEQVCSRFDYYLKRLHRSGNTQRGIIIIDKSVYETAIQVLARDFRTIGHTWGQTRNIADVPLFVDSRATRLVQYADLIAYAYRRQYEHGDAQYANIIAPRVDMEGGTIHGLIHHVATRGLCACLYCSQRAPSGG